MFLFGSTRPFFSTTTTCRFPTLSLSATPALFAALLVCSGCGDSEAPVPPNTQAKSTPVADSREAGQGESDPLADVLRLAEAGDTDAAIKQWVDDPPENWVESTSLEEFQLSDAGFADLSGDERNRLQQQFIDRIGEIRGFAREVIKRAEEAKQRGDEETAQKYVEAVRRFGRQLRDSDTVVLFQQTGNALAKSSLSD